METTSVSDRPPRAAGGRPLPDDDCPVAATMRRVQEQLRLGQAPTFESLLALGEPGRV